ncbi:hypothetical protein DYB25_014080 [Aphanomyces astaci]|uniref:Uncharacterized protein n=1 Tax=Aphanomyces astaci TaxID=112090 RepID=A0A397CDF2_APHAT|nr:hypothetical protein DYB36_014205 [Aphanomyces astaci]RHY26316.1 hypothetical protein DYB25_014080 [Aphanomyces astaci]RHY44504.1 hypothetical protein DYB38_011400 [Aphanomyces astaci]RHY65352.1 hypothetical protein DYB34_014180 [Aphanomyces astaci]RHY87576.1 hypothetical protein DYB31_011536 [Aphanomyces astaci]
MDHRMRARMDGVLCLTILTEALRSNCRCDSLSEITMDRRSLAHVSIAPTTKQSDVAGLITADAAQAAKLYALYNKGEDVSGTALPDYLNEAANLAQFVLVTNRKARSFQGARGRVVLIQWSNFKTLLTNPRMFAAIGRKIQEAVLESLDVHFSMPPAPSTNVPRQVSAQVPRQGGATNGKRRRQPPVRHTFQPADSNSDDE